MNILLLSSFVNTNVGVLLGLGLVFLLGGALFFILFLMGASRERPYLPARVTSHLHLIEGEPGSPENRKKIAHHYQEVFDLEPLISTNFESEES